MLEQLGELDPLGNDIDLAQHTVLHCLQHNLQIAVTVVSQGAELQLGQVSHALPQPKTQFLVLETRELAVCLPRPPPDSPLCGTDLVLEGWPEQSSLLLSLGPVEK